MRIPLVVDIKRHSLEDGPGIRSVVFFKGCPLRCRFCQNPETQYPGLELAFNEDRCIGCFACVSCCERQAIEIGTHRPRLHRDRCHPCKLCSQACPGGALTTVGDEYSIDALTEILLRDQSYYRHSQGGVTFSGGECTLYPEYVGDLAGHLKENSIHLVLQTCGHFAFDDFARWLLPHLDLIFYDIKLANSQRHQMITGKDNLLIWANLSKLVSLVPERIQPRIPLIKNMTSDEDNIRQITRQLKHLGAKPPLFLPENPWGAVMRPRLGQKD